MTVIVVNAISVKEGGSLVVLRELVAGMASLRPQWEWHIVANSATDRSLPELPNVVYHRFPVVDQDGWRTRLWYETGLIRLLRRVRASLLFSMTNYLPVRRSPCPSLLLVQHAGHFSELFGRLFEERHGLAGRLAWRLKGRWVRASIRRANSVTVQTAALARRITCETGIPPDRVGVIPHGTGQAKLRLQPASHIGKGEVFRIGYVTKYGVQKNFRVLFAAAARLREAGLPLSLVLTLSRSVHEYREVMSAAEAEGVADLIENHGELSLHCIDQLYESLHAFVFPSLCESFGMPMAEAMAHGLPLLVADVTSNSEVAGSGGQLFAAHDDVALALALERLARDPEWFAQRARASRTRAADFDWTRAVAGTLALIEETLETCSVRESRIS